MLLYVCASELFAQQKDSVVVSKFKSEFVSIDNDLTEKELRHVKRGDLIFSMGPLKYEQALEEYFKALETSSDNSLLNFKVGYCYLNINKLKSRSIIYLEKALSVTGKKVDPKIRYYLGKAYQANHNPDRAIQEYKKYILEVKKALKPETKGSPLELVELSRLQERDISDAYKKIDECKNLLKYYKNPVKVKLVPLSDSVNSPYAEYDPFISLDEADLYFTSRRPSTKGGGRAERDGEYYEDIYVSHKKNGKWGKAKPMRGINKNTNDAITGLSFDGTKMFIYRDVNGGDIYLSEMKGLWSKLRNLKEINSEFHESSACISVDGKTLYFVSDRPGGEGGRDIYMSTLDADNKWGKPSNIGSEINTPYDEDRIYVHPYTKALFFSSKGHNSLGGYDVFVCDYVNGAWIAPKNLGYPINDVDDDFSFVITDDMKHGYYSSFKENGKGDKDIYFVDFENTENDSALKSLNVDFKQIAYDDSVNASIIALNKKISENPLAYVDARQLHILDSLAVKNGKITEKALQKSKFGELPLNTKNLMILDSIAQADHKLTASAIDKIVNNHKDLSATYLDRKQLAVLDSIARINKKITAKILLQANYTGAPLSSAQLNILDSLVKVNGVLTAKAISQTNFANYSNRDITVNEIISDNIIPKTIEPGITSHQLFILDSLAKTNGKVTSKALNKTSFYNGSMTIVVPARASFTAPEQSVLPTDDTDKNSKFDMLENTLTNQQFRKLDSLAEAKEINSTVALNKPDPVITDQVVVSNKTTSQDMRPDVIQPDFSAKQVQILDSLAKANKKITLSELSKTNFVSKKGNGSIGLTASQLHILDSLAKADESITVYAINKTNFSARNPRAAQKNIEIQSTNYITDEATFTDNQLRILDSLAKTNKKITATMLSKTAFGVVVEYPNGDILAKSATDSSGVVKVSSRQIRILDSLAEANTGITASTLSKVNFSETNHITDPLAKTNINIATTATTNNNRLEKGDPLNKTTGTSKDITLADQDKVVNKNNTDASSNIATEPEAFNNILFEFNKHDIGQEYFTLLNNLISYIKKNSSYKIKITGFTDSKGNDDYNLALSKKRAQAVANYLTGKGINKNRIKLDYKGEARAIAPNENPDKSDNPEGRKLNRRVEINILAGITLATR